MQGSNRKAYLALAWVSFFLGTTYLAAKISAEHIPGLFIACVRQLACGLVLVGWCMVRRMAWPDKTSLGRIAVQAILLLCISQGLLTWALEYIESGLAAIIAGLMPLFVALFSIVLLKTVRFTRLVVLGLLIGFAGIVIIFYKHFSELANHQYAFGIGLCLVATMGWSFGTVYTVRYKPAADLFFSVGLQMLMAGSVLVVVCLASGKYVNLLHINTNALWALLYLIIIGSLLTHSIYIYVVNKLPPTQVSIYAYINPIVAIGLGWLLLGEQMGANVLIGTAVTFGGIFLVNREFRLQKEKSVRDTAAINSK